MRAVRFDVLARNQVRLYEGGHRPVMEKLSLILWRERELLDTLQFNLEVEQVLLDSGRSRWLMRVAREVASVLGTIRETEILRAVAAEDAAAGAGLDSNVSLAMLAEAADEPWRSILREHRDAFRKVTAEIAELADANHDLISAGYLSARELLTTLGAVGEGTVPPETDHENHDDRRA